VVTLRDSCEVRTESRFNFVVVTLCDSCEVRTESRFHFVVVTLRDSCEVRTESRFHFVVVTLRDSCEVRTESRFNFVVVSTLLQDILHPSHQPAWRQLTGPLCLQWKEDYCTVTRLQTLILC
jgi:hypothetical protein